MKRDATVKQRKYQACLAPYTFRRTIDCTISPAPGTQSPTGLAFFASNAKQWSSGNARKSPLMGLARITRRLCFVSDAKKAKAADDGIRRR